MEISLRPAGIDLYLRWTALWHLQLDLASRSITRSGTHILAVADGRISEVGSVSSGLPGRSFHAAPASP